MCAYYKASTKMQMKHKNSTNTQNTKQAKQKQYGRKKAIQGVIGQNPKT